MLHIFPQLCSQRQQLSEVHIKVQEYGFIHCKKLMCHVIVKRIFIICKLVIEERSCQRSFD